MRLSSPILTHYRQALLLIGWFVISLILLRSLLRDASFNTVIEPTPYRLDLNLWPSNTTTTNGVVERLTFDNDWKPVTAVIHQVSSNENDIRQRVHELLEYPFIQQVLIHRGDTTLTTKLTVEQLDLDPLQQARVEILEPGSSSEPFGTFARFMTCAMASYDVCYFQDDTWSHHAMDSLYTNMVRYPNLIHAISPPSLYLDQLRWRFSNPEISMHAGFVDMQYGAFVPRWKCQTFLTQLGKSGFGKDQIRLADTLFSLWTNQYPWILAGPIYGHQALNNTPTWPIPPLATMSKGIRRLQQVLEADTSDTPKDYFERVEEVPRLDERDVRAACDNDRCLFITSMDPLPAPTELIYNRHDIRSMQHWEETYNELGNSNDFFDQHPYHFAVDKDPDTCWNTFHYPTTNDYFGLIFIGGDEQPDQFTMYTNNKVDHPEKQFKIAVTSDGEEWIDCDTADPALWDVTTPQQVQVRLKCAKDDDDDYKEPVARALRITFLENMKESFTVCGMDVGTLAL